MTHLDACCTACSQGGANSNGVRKQLFSPTEAAQMLQAAPKDRPPEFVVAFIAFTRTNLVINSVGFTGLAPE